MNILAVDIGTKLGFANNFTKHPASGRWDLTPKRLEGSGVRYLRFKNEFTALIARGAEMVTFEEVRRHRGTAAAHVYGGIVAILMSTCEEKNIHYTSVPVGTWKKEICGKGNITPPAYLEYVRKNMLPGCKTEDEAAALCILEWAERTYNASEPDYLQ